jgi:ferritin-like metal-binding protein YciE
MVDHGTKTLINKWNNARQSNEENNMPELQEMLVDEMQDLLHAEHQLVKALPKMAKAAHDPKLKQAFEKHLEQTQGHVERLERAFEILNVKPKTKVCKAMQGLIAEGQEKITEGKEKEEFIADLELAGAAQKVEHYEIAGYGTIRAVAEKIGQEKLVRLLGETLTEEEKTDKLLTELCAPILDAASQESGIVEEETTGRARHKTVGAR